MSKVADRGTRIALVSVNLSSQFPSFMVTFEKALSGHPLPGPRSGFTTITENQPGEAKGLLSGSLLVRFLAQNPVLTAIRLKRAFRTWIIWLRGGKQFQFPNG